MSRVKNPTPTANEQGGGRAQERRRSRAGFRQRTPPWAHGEPSCQPTATRVARGPRASAAVDSEAADPTRPNAYRPRRLSPQPKPQGDLPRLPLPRPAAADFGTTRRTANFSANFGYLKLSLPQAASTRPPTLQPDRPKDPQHSHNLLQRGGGAPHGHATPPTAEAHRLATPSSRQPTRLALPACTRASALSFCGGHVGVLVSYGGHSSRTSKKACEVHNGGRPECGRHRSPRARIWKNFGPTGTV